MGLVYKTLDFQFLHPGFLCKSRTLGRAPLFSRVSTRPGLVSYTHTVRPTLELLDARQPGCVEKPVGEGLVLKGDAAELLPAVHIPGAHTHADFLGL